MAEPLDFDYYYGIEAEQFSFYRVPRLLVKDARFKGLSSDAKLLYGLMLDRMSLSVKNGWIDEENRAYIIYSVENVMEDFGYSKPTCIKVMRELDSENGIGLIEKKRRGLGKPDIIYVKNFASSAEKSAENTDKSTEVKNLYFKKSKNFTSGSKETLPLEVKEADFKRSKNFTSGSQETLLQEVKNVDPNYTDYNYTDMSYTDMNQINPVSQTEGQDGTDMTEKYISVIRKNIDYEVYTGEDNKDRELYEELFDVICDVVCVKRATVRIEGENYPYEIVKAKFLKLNSTHLLYVISRMQETNTEITNIKAYMVTALYNAPSTISHYYQQKVQYDLYGGGRHET